MAVTPPPKTASPFPGFPLIHRQEIQHILILSLPIIIAQFAQAANGFVDTIMAGHVSANDLAAVAVGSAIWLPILLFLMGVMQGLTPIVSQLHGARNIPSIGHWVHQGLWLALPMGLLGWLLIRSMEPVLRWMAVDTDIQPMILAYLDAVSWGMLPITGLLALRSLLEGTARTQPFMVISLLGLVANVPLNYVFIYGKLGLPAMGGVGCGWATALVMTLEAILAAIYCLSVEKTFPVGLKTAFTLPDPSRLMHILKVGVPIGVAIFLEVSLFCVVALFLASIHADIVASHQIALNTTSMLFMVPLSLSMALTIRVGFHRGRHDHTRVRQAIVSGLLVLMLTAVLNCTLILLFRTPIASLYTHNPDIVQLAGTLLLFAAAFQISDCLQVGANGILRGLKDTTLPMMLTLLAYWGIGLPVGYLLGMSHFAGEPWGASGFWVGLILGLTVAAILLGWRVFWQFKRLDR